MLWAVLDSNLPTNLVRTALQCAGDIPLTITARQIQRRRSTDFDTEEMRAWAASRDGVDFLSAVLPTLARWKDARLDLEPPVPEDLRQHGPTVEEVIQLIGLPPHLKHFYTRRLQFSDPPQDVPLVEIPQLESLGVWDIDASSIQHILSRIRAPTVTHLAVKLPKYRPRDYQLSTFLDVALGHFEQIIRSAIEHAHSLHISIDSYDRIISVSTRHEDSSSMFKNEVIMLDLYHHPILDGFQLCLGFLLPCPPLCPPITLDILEISNSLESDLQWMLGSAINDRVTEVHLRAFDGCRFLSFLCTAGNCGGIAKWPFPRLRTLTLPEGVSGEEAVFLISQRDAPASKDFNQIPRFSSGDFVFEPVDRLIQLDLKAVMLDDTAYDRLASIFGEDVLVTGDDSDASDYVN
ncbi:hypothetical protein FRC00_008002 [Tulasnella sp. 408]|nr:hypothetical protein FRC00_008002 [Tulasnella sp. 408]